MAFTRYRSRRLRHSRWGPFGNPYDHDHRSLWAWAVNGLLVGVALFAIALLTRPRAINTALPGQVIVIRHGEKPADRSNAHLAPAGVARAEQLVSFITTDSTMLRFGLPVALFATMTTKNQRGYRTQETLAPLASALHLPVQTPFRGKDEVAMAHLILANPAFAGKTVVVAWNHEQLTQLAAALGVRPAPPTWADSVFDRVYVIAYKDGAATLELSRYGSQ